MIKIPWNRDVTKDVEIMDFTVVYFRGHRSPQRWLEECELNAWLLCLFNYGRVSSPGTSDIRGQIILCCRVLPCAWRMFISLSQLAASCTPSTLLIIKNISTHRQMSPEGQIPPPLPAAIENSWPASYYQSLLSMTASSGDGVLEGPGCLFTQASTYVCKHVTLTCRTSGLGM